MQEAILKALDSVERNQLEIKDRLLQVEQRPTAFDGITTKAASLGDAFVKSFNENRELLEKVRSIRLEVKAAGDAITTSSGRSIVIGGVGSPSANTIGFQNALTTRPAPSTSACEYSRYTGLQGAAGVQSNEGDSKAAVRPDHTLVTQSALTVAGYAKMSRQALSDSAELKRSVDITLRRSVGTALDTALVNGCVGFTGGFEGLATASTSLVYTGMVDAISEGVSTMQVAGFAPDVVGLNPADWLVAALPAIDSSPSSTDNTSPSACAPAMISAPVISEPR